MSVQKLDERRHRANRVRRTCLRRSLWGAALLSLALAACADGGSTGAGQGRDLAFPDLRDFPEPPASPPPLAQREEIGNELLADLERQRYESAALRHRVGLAPAPATPAAPPTMPALPEAETPEAPSPTASPTARYLRQQILWETRDSNLSDFMDRLTTAPVALDPALAAESTTGIEDLGEDGPDIDEGTVAAEPRPRPLVPPRGAVPELPTAPEPLLDRFLAWAGVGGGGG